MEGEREGFAQIAFTVRNVLYATSHPSPLKKHKRIGSSASFAYHRFNTAASLLITMWREKDEQLVQPLQNCCQLFSRLNNSFKMASQKTQSEVANPNSHVASPKSLLKPFEYKYKL